MRRVKTLLLLLLLLSLCFLSVQAQDNPTPLPGVTTTLIDSAVYNGIYRGHQSQIFCEPTTGNLAAAWYWYNGSDPNPRRIYCAVSTDGGATWTIFKDLNQGVGDVMNARYPSVWGTATTPIVSYSDRNPPGDYQNARPVVAYDVAGWGGGVFDNVYVNNGGTADTILYERYLSVKVAPDDPDFWAVGGYHNADPGEMLDYYYSVDGGLTWEGPFIPVSSADADSNKPYYVADLSSSGLGVALGNNGFVMATGLAQYADDDNDLWRIIYMSSTDHGETWTSPALIPGTEDLSFANGEVYRQFTEPIQDQAGNWHVFGLGLDTTETNEAGFPDPYRIWDFVYDGSTWTIHKIAFPQLLENGLNAWGDYVDQELYAMCQPAVGPDGTIYLVYSDVVDTTGATDTAGVHVEMFEFNMMVIYSEDNGETWQGPVAILENWAGMQPNGVARYATDKLHVVYSKYNGPDIDRTFHYMGVPTELIKTVGIDDQVTTLKPERFRLRQNYPNPFNPVTTIRFDLRDDAEVTLTIYNALGQEVARPIDHRFMRAGYKGISFDGRNLPSGTYFYRLQAGNNIETRKMTLIK